MTNSSSCAICRREIDPEELLCPGCGAPTPEGRLGYLLGVAGIPESYRGRAAELASCQAAVALASLVVLALVAAGLVLDPVRDGQASNTWAQSSGAAAAAPKQALAAAEPGQALTPSRYAALGGQRRVAAYQPKLPKHLCTLREVNLRLDSMSRGALRPQLAALQAKSLVAVTLANGTEIVADCLRVAHRSLVPLPTKAGVARTSCDRCARGGGSPARPPVTRTSARTAARSWQGLRPITQVAAYAR